MFPPDEKKPKKQLETSRGGPGGRGKTAVGAEDGDSSAPEPLPTESPIYPNLRAIVAERHELIKFGLRKVLAHFVTLVGDATDLLQAWEIAKRIHPELIFTEIDIDRGNALDFCSRVKRELPSKIIVITDLHHATRYYHRLKRLDVSGLCRKYNPYAFAEAVSAAINNQQYIDEAITALVQQNLADTATVINRHELDVLLRSALDDEEIANELGCDQDDVERAIESHCARFGVMRAELSNKCKGLGLIPLPVERAHDPVTGVHYEQVVSGILAETAIAQEHLKALILRLRLIQ